MSRDLSLEVRESVTGINFLYTENEPVTTHLCKMFRHVKYESCWQIPNPFPIHIISVILATGKLEPHCKS